VANVGVTFDFAAESAKLRTEVDKVRKEMSKLTQTAQTVEKGFKVVGTAIVGAFSIGAITGWLRTVNQAADTLNDLSTRLGASASGLQSLQIAAQQAGGSAEGLNTAISRMTVTLGDALAGEKEAVRGFERLGLSAKELAGLKADEAFLRIDAALGQIGNSFERASIGADIFGKTYVKELAGLSGDAAAEVMRVNDELERQGALLSDLDVTKIGVMNDDLALQSQIVQNLGIKFSANLSPAIGVAVDSVGNLITSMGGAAAAGSGFGVAMVAAIKSIEAVVYSLAAAFEIMRSSAATAFAVLATGPQKIAGPFGNALGILTGAIRAYGDNNEAAKSAAESLDSIARSALENARLAGAAAIKAGSDVFNAAAVFDEKSREFEARAAAAAARATAAQGAAAGVGIGAAAGATADRSGLLTVSKESLGKIDPQLDPEVLRQTSINDTLAAVQDAHNATMLGKIEAFEQTKLGMLLTNADLMQQIEFNKNATLGDAMSSLVGLAIQQGGALGKAGKALAIAQTVWSTGQAIMKAMAEVPWPANIAAAANIAAMGVAQLANIKRTNIGGAGSITAGRGGGASAAASPALSDNVGPQGQPLEQQTAVQIIVNGSLFAAQETVDWLAEKLGEAVSSRDMVFISNTSRQAMELRG
jgi:hypothetical protein